MNNALPSGSMQTTLRWNHGGLFLVFIALGGILLWQSKLWHSVGNAPTSRESSLSQSIQSRLNSMSIALMNYLQTQDPDALAQVERQGKASAELVEQFKTETAGALSEITQKVEASHETQRQAAMSLLMAQSNVDEARMIFSRRQQSLLEVLEKYLLGSIKPSMWKGSEQVRALFSVTGEVKSLHFPSGQIPSANPVFAKVRQFLMDFQRQTSARQGPAIEEANRQLVACSEAWMLAAQRDQEKRDALKAFAKSRQDLDQALEEYNRASVRMNSEGSSRSTFQKGFISGLTGFLLMLVGSWFLWRLEHQTRSQWLSPLQELTRCLEAAASGDLSRMPPPASSDELGRLSQALHRTMTVMTRSENLVYHLAALVEASGDAIISQSLDGTILSWNKGAQRMYGYSVEEVKGKSIAMVSPQDGGYQLRGLLQCMARGEKIPPFEAIHQAKNGRALYAFVKVAAIYDSTRKIIGASFCAQELPPPNAPEIQGSPAMPEPLRLHTDSPGPLA